METHTGYKTTTVGVIPGNWDVKRLGEIFSISAGQSKSAYVAPGGRYWVVDMGSVSTDGRLTVSKATDYSGDFLSIGELVMPKDDIGGGGIIGKVGYIDADDTYVLGDHVYRLKANLGDPLFLSYVINGYRTNTELRTKVIGSAQLGLGRKSVDEQEVPFPSYDEQVAIAEALSDADALIESLEQLLPKKRRLKQGAMQELLTGKKRLAGFSGEWEPKPFNDVCWFQEGPGVRNTQFTTSGVKLLNGTNIVRGVLNLDSTSRFISEREASGAYAHFLADAGDVVIASSGITIDRFHEKVAFVRDCDLPLCMNTSTIRFKPFARVLDSDFLFQFLTSAPFKRAIGGQATGSAQLNFGPSHVAKVTIPLPPYSEQIHIAAVLSDMDAEIAALEGKHTKASEVKQGMMQELLTGRIRLV